MWAWLQQNHGQVSALASVLTLVIWTLYFQLLLSSYRYRLRPKILINRGAGHTLKAHCLIANMSAEPVYIEAVVTDLGCRTDGDRVTRHRCSLSELDLEVSSGGDPRPQWFQGPLKSGEWIDIGTYERLIDRARKTTGVTDPVCEVTVTVVATYTAQDSPVAAFRTFELGNHGDCPILAPRTFTATQIRSRAARRAIERSMLGRKSP
ncbi:hypothetical protein [Nitratireductor sp. ZSWI3]|uniref:hypothetical protein n=1 Tax=Nitratireductor sp. ZSWI3 TaxID=2966359 RepID=UPI00214F65CD|nr:hypothetical protein [Nitratireductor sp. ZSWI3]MCR4264679.1 hypothetical protein [Nitratireductor sp. ZSWI3]